MSKMNFAIALRMTTDQFKRGADVVKKSLMQLQYQVLGMASALGLGGIGLKNMVSRFVDVARETTRARVALRNISGDAQGFSKNMDFLVRTSNRWGQELNGMTSEFAKFSAAASSAGISIQDQHTIFESFTRSITAFGMSSEDAHLAYLALSQMMSKGKISSEELRRQLGERMPVAMEAMARAVGVTIQELDGLLKAGKLISKDVMLPFVKEMEKMLPEVNVDNIGTSVNRLKNTFTQLTQDLKIGEYFKKIVDWANSMLGNIQTSFMRVVAVIVAAFTSGKIAKAYSSLTQKVIAENQKVLTNKVQTEQQLELATAKRVAAEKKYNELSVLYSQASNETKIAHYAKLTAAESAMNKWRLREQAGLKAVQEANAAQMVTRWGVAWGGVKKVAVTAITTIKSAFATFLPMAVFTLLTNFVMKLVEARKEAQRIKNMFADYRSELNKIDGGQEAKILQTSLDILKDRKSTTEEIKNAQAAINGILGEELKSQDELLKKGEERIKQLVAMARANYQANKIVETEEQIKDIYSKYGGESSMNKQFINAPYQKGIINKALGWLDPVEVDMNKLVSLRKILEDAESDLRVAIETGIYSTGGATGSGGGGSKSQYTPSAGGESKKKDKNAPDDIKGLSGLYELQKVIEANKHKFKPISGGASMVGYDPRDTTFDYKKSESDILEEEYGQLEKYIQRLREEGKVAMEEIWKEEQKLTSLSDALKLAQLKEDIKEMNLSIFEQSIDGVTGFADALDRAARSWSRMANEDMSGFERMVSIINAIGDSIKGLIGTWETYMALKELISAREKALQAQDNVITAQSIANTLAETTVESAAATKNVAGNIAEATTEATISAAKLPFPANIAAVALAAAAVYGILSSFAKFEKGGIVGGLKGGDRNLVRVNGGEMIMTTPQQSKLWGAIKNGDFGGGPRQWEFVLKGKDLVAIEKIQNRRASRI